MQSQSAVTTGVELSTWCWIRAETVSLSLGMIEASFHTSWFWDLAVSESSLRKYDESLTALSSLHWVWDPMKAVQTNWTVRMEAGAPVWHTATYYRSDFVLLEWEFVIHLWKGKTLLPIKTNPQGMWKSGLPLFQTKGIIIQCFFFFTEHPECDGFRCLQCRKNEM